MKIIVNELDPIQFRKHHPYVRLMPTLVSDLVSGKDEIARWVLDVNGIGYYDQRHLPLLGSSIIQKLTGKRGLRNAPVLIMTDKLIYRTDSIIRYYEERCTPDASLIAKDDSRSEQLDLYRWFAVELDQQVQKYMLTRLLEAGSIFRSVFSPGKPLLERIVCLLGYPFYRRRMINRFNLDTNTAEERFIEIKKVFDQVSEILSNGQRYLCGDRISIADIAFASVGAVLVLPEEYGGSIPHLKQIPMSYRNDVIQLRNTAAGQFILRLYREERPTPISQSDLPSVPGLLASIKQRLSILFQKGQPSLFSFLQRFLPLFKIPFFPVTIATRNCLVSEILTRDNDFTIEEINSRKMALQKGAFFLGWDKTYPEFDRERDFARSVIQRSDLAIIQSLIRQSCDSLTTANKHYGRLDVAMTLCRPTLVRLMDVYFGVSAANDTIMMDWLRILFYDLFLNLTNNKKIHAQAVAAGIARRDWIRQLIITRKASLNSGANLPDNVLNRMIQQANTPGFSWVDEDVINRSIGGLLTGVFETSNKAVIHVISYLLDKPNLLNGAIQASVIRDMDQLRGYVWEALRFAPVQPGVLRYSPTKQELKSDSKRSFTVKARNIVMALTASAMFDPNEFLMPHDFNPSRLGNGARYMNFGYGFHECFGRHINMVVLPEFVAAVLRLKNVRRAEGMAGRGVGLTTHGFPNNFIVAFDAGSKHDDDE